MQAQQVGERTDPISMIRDMAGFDQTTAGIRPIVSAWVTLMPYVSARRRDVRFGFGRNNYCDRADCVARPSRVISECIAENQLTGKTTFANSGSRRRSGGEPAGKQCTEITAETLGHDLWTTDEA
jgi:hypothetical protein